MIDRQKMIHMGAIALIISIFCFHLFTLSKGSSWGDDWTMYVNHAYNMVHGRPYVYPGYIYNPMYPTYSPSAYPPGYPLMIAPVVAIWGIELTPLKIANLIILSAALYLLWLLLKSQLKPLSALSVVALTGFLPFFWQMRDQILSDIPYLAASLLAFYMLNRWENHPDWRKACFLGCLIFFPLAVRSVGIALIAAWGAHVLLDKSYRNKFNVAALGLALILAFVQNLLLPAGPGYGHMLVKEYEHTVFIPKLLYNLYSSGQYYMNSLGEGLQLNGGNDFPVFGKLLAVVIPVLAFSGLVSRRRWTVMETYLCFYLLVLFLYPARQGFRFMIGVFPLLLYYGFWFAEQLPRRAVRLALAGILLPVFLTYLTSWYAHNHDQAIIGNMMEENTQNLFRFVRDSVPQDAVLVADRPRIFALFTNHKGTVFPDQNHENDWMEWLNQNNVTYAVKAVWDNDKPDRYWARYMDAHPEEFQKLFEDRGLQVYRYIRQGTAQ